MLIKKIIANLFLSKKPLQSQEYVLRHLGYLLIKRKSDAIKHLPDKENLINNLFYQCAKWRIVMQTMSFLDRKQINTIASILEYHRNIKWTTFLDSLNTCNQITITQITMLIQILLQESISKEKVCKPFWKNA